MSVYQKKIIQYFLLLVLSVFLGMGIVALEAAFFLKDMDFVTGVFVGIFKGLKRKLIIYLGGFIGVLSFIVFLPIHNYLIIERFNTKKKQYLISFFMLLVLILVLKIIHSLVDYTFNWI